MWVMCCLLTAPLALQGQQAPRPTPPPRGRSQEHLPQWMDRHRNLSLPQQQSALEKEPGFRDLPPRTQQRMLDRLTQLNHMPPDRRQRLLERTEAMEQLTPEQRQQVRGAMRELSSLPRDRRRVVAQAFRDMRAMPIPQRQVVLNSEDFRRQFSKQEHDTLGNLLAVEPYLPSQQANRPSGLGR